MKQHTITSYTFEELSADAQEKAIENMYDINVSYDWWEFIYEEIETLGLQCQGFDLDRANYCTLKAIDDYEAIASKIIAEHGVTCDTHKTAIKYMADRSELVCKHSNGIETNIVSEDNECEFDCDCEDLDIEFLRTLSEDYCSLLKREYEYNTSKEAIIETIQANEYDFLENGTQY